MGQKGRRNTGKEEYREEVGVSRKMDGCILFIKAENTVGTTSSFGEEVIKKIQF